MSELCKWLHEKLEQLPLIKYPFELERLPDNGIYFFYEDGEIWGHEGEKLRIVRIGTHKKDGNFRSRIKEHFLLDESKMNFDITKPAPHERSIFRKNIGRALLNKKKDDYLKIWEIDFTTRGSREKYANLRDIQKEKEIEAEITKILRERFSFRFIIIDEQEKRTRMESSLIGTVANCKLCRASCAWLGRYSPKKQIKQSGLWLAQHLNAKQIAESNKPEIDNFIMKTKKDYEIHLIKMYRIATYKCMNCGKKIIIDDHFDDVLANLIDAMNILLRTENIIKADIDPKSLTVSDILNKAFHCCSSPKYSLSEVLKT